MLRNVVAGVSVLSHMVHVQRESFWDTVETGLQWLAFSWCRKPRGSLMLVDLREKAMGFWVLCCAAQGPHD